MKVCSNCDASNLNWAEFCTECDLELTDIPGDGGVPEVVLPLGKRIRFAVKNKLNIQQNETLKDQMGDKVSDLKEVAAENHRLSEVITQRLPRAVLELEERLNALEKKFLERGYDTRPMFETHADQIRQLQDQVKRLEERLRA